MMAQLVSAMTGMVEVPFDLYHNSILVKVKVDGQGPFNMLLDTGVNPSVIDRRTAKALGVKMSAQGEPGSGTGSDVNLAYECSLPKVEIGPLEATNVEALAMNLSKTSAALGKPLQGVLGYSLFKGRVVQFDYPKRVARFYPSNPSPQPASSNDTTLSFTYQDDILLGGITVNGKNVIATLDTGCNGSFQLTPKAIAQLGLEKELREAEVSHSTGFNGQAENRKGKVSRITVGSISMDKPEVVFFNKGSGYDDVAWGLRIGNAFLKDFVVTVDYQNDKITLERATRETGKD